MKLQLVNVDDKAVLDTITLVDGALAYETGAARGPVESWQRARGLNEADAFAQLSEEGWSNGYAAIRRV